MNIKAIKVEIEKGAAKEDVARQIGDAVAEAIGTAEAEDETAADNLDREAVKELMETEDFKAFYAEVTNRVNELVDLIQANKAKYNCSVIVGLTSLMGKASNFCGVAHCGRVDSLHKSFDKILKVDPIRRVIFAKALKPLVES